MRFASTIAIAAMSAGTSYAAYDSCMPGDYGVWMVSFMQGFQEDPTKTDTDCSIDV